MEKYFKPAVLTFLYLFSGFLGVILAVLLLFLFNPNLRNIELQIDSDDNKIFELLSSYTFLIQLSGVLIACFFVWSMNMVDIKKAYDFKNVDWKNAWKAICGAVLYVIGVSLLGEMLGIEQDDADVSHCLSETIAGALTLAIFNPIVTEFVFREANIRHMLRCGASYMQALLYSSFLYSLICVFEPSVAVQTFLFSLVYSAIYLKTHNVILSTIVQIIVNVGCVLLLLFYDYKSYTASFMDCMLFLALFGYPCYRLLRSFFKDEPVFPPVLWLKTKRLMVNMR